MEKHDEKKLELLTSFFNELIKKVDYIDGFLKGLDIADRYKKKETADCGKIIEFRRVSK